MAKTLVTIKGCGHLKMIEETGTAVKGEDSAIMTIMVLIIK
jgi:hypothetical protein